jgi:hypothetical protein
MATNAGIAYASTFGILNGSSYTNVAEVTSITPPQYSRDAIEATHHGSPNTYREYVPGMIDGGEVSLEINYIPSNADVIITAVQAGTGQFKITHPNAISVTFNAIVTAYSPETPLDGKMNAKVTFKVTGRPTWA